MELDLHSSKINVSSYKSQGAFSNPSHLNRSKDYSLHCSKTRRQPGNPEIHSQGPLFRTFITAAFCYWSRKWTSVRAGLFCSLTANSLRLQTRIYPFIHTSRVLFVKGDLLCSFPTPHFYSRISVAVCVPELLHWALVPSTISSTTWNEL